MKFCSVNKTSPLHCFAMDWKQNGGRLTELCGVLLLCLIAINTSDAQTTIEGSAPAKAAVSSAPSNIEILKLEWKREVRLPRNFDPAVIPTGATFSDPASRTSSNTGSTVVTETARARSAAESSGVAFPAAPSRLPVFYVYSIKIRNTGAKAIVGIAWDYIFIDPGLNAEVGRHQFLSYAQIPTNKALTLHGELRTPPIRVIGAAASDKSKHSRYTERAVVQCLLYEDDSVWKNPNGKDGICDFLKKNKTLVKRKHAASRQN